MMKRFFFPALIVLDTVCLLTHGMTSIESQAAPLPGNMTRPWISAHDESKRSRFASLHRHLISRRVGSKNLRCTDDLKWDWIRRCCASLARDEIRCSTFIISLIVICHIINHETCVTTSLEPCVVLWWDSVEGKIYRKRTSIPHFIMPSP